MLEKEYFVNENHYKKFKKIFIKWDRLLNRYKFKIKDNLLEEKFNDVIKEFQNEKIKLESITKNKPKDFLVLKKVKINSKNNEYKITLFFKSELNTKAKISRTYKLKTNTEKGSYE